MCHPNHRPLNKFFPKHELNGWNIEKPETSETFQTALLSKNSGSETFRHHSDNEHATADAGATGHFLKPDSHFVNKRCAANKVRVLSAEKSATMSDFKCNCDAPQLPLDATEANIMSATWAHNSLSIAKFCDNECEVLFTEDSGTVARHGKVLLTGVRNICRTNPWLLPLKPTPRDSQCTDDAKHEHPHHSRVAHHATSEAESLQCSHAACFSLKPATWMKAIENEQFKSWPGLTKPAVKNHLPSSMATAKGHLDRQRKKRKSTRATFEQDIELDEMIKQETKDEDEPIRRTSKRLRATANRAKNDAACLQLFLANTHKQTGIERPASPTSVTQCPEHARVTAQHEDPADTPTPAKAPITDPNVCDATDDPFPPQTDEKQTTFSPSSVLQTKLKTQSARTSREDFHLHLQKATNVCWSHANATATAFLPSH